MSANFDDYARDYRDQVQRSINFIGQDHDFFVRSKVNHLVHLTRRRLGDPNRLGVLDVGCGVGATDSHLVGTFGRVSGSDVSSEALAVARDRNPMVDYRFHEGNALPFDAEVFDVSFMIGVLHHVPLIARQRVVDEMTRVTRGSGLVVVFEHNPLNPLTRRAVRGCEFDEGVVLLEKRETRSRMLESGLSVRDEGYILFLPWMLHLSTALDRRLGRVPLGAQYYVAGVRTPPPSA